LGVDESGPERDSPTKGQPYEACDMKLVVATGASVIWPRQWRRRQPRALWPNGITRRSGATEGRNHHGENWPLLGLRPLSVEHTGCVSAAPLATVDSTTARPDRRIDLWVPACCCQSKFQHSRQPCNWVVLEDNGRPRCVQSLLPERIAWLRPNRLTETACR
jgi:hypothetical protein